jgi:signal transduction histidine kinase
MRQPTRWAYLLLVLVGLLANSLQWHGLPSPHWWLHSGAGLIYVSATVAAAIRGTTTGYLSVVMAGGAVHALLRVSGDTCPWIQIVGNVLLVACVSSLAALLPLTPAGARPSRNGSDAQPQANIGSSGTWPTSELTRVIVGLVRQFGTPLTSIQGAAWMLADSTLSEDKRHEFVAIIRKESQRLSSILSEVLVFARPRQPSFQPLDLSGLIDEVVNLARTTARGSTIRFSKHIPEPLPRVPGDVEQLTQALQNLVMNAVEACPPDGRVEISAQLEGHRLVVTVTDHGQGISASALERIRDPFFSTRQNSLGLGLPIAAQIIADHGGSIEVSSAVDQGTRVSVFLPISPAR